MEAFDALNDTRPSQLQTNMGDNIQQYGQQIRAIPVQRLLSDRQDPFRLFDEEQFIARFREATVLYILCIDLISSEIDPPTRRHFAKVHPQNIRIVDCDSRWFQGGVR